MRVLLIKTSSMGDVIHTLPALTDAANAIPNIKFDWLVEKSFAEIPAWHPSVDKVIPLSFRKWRKNIFAPENFQETRHLITVLRRSTYDVILDAQGLIKSALFSFAAKGKRVGLDWDSARESFASVVYQKKISVNFYQHAIVRMRELFSKGIGYPLPNHAPCFGLQLPQKIMQVTHEKYIVLLHGTTWETKLWPESYWCELANRLKAAGYKLKISGGNASEISRAQRIANSCDAVEVLPYLEIATMASLLQRATAAVAVDTGFGHLAAALGVPTISLYGATNAIYTGALGQQSIHLQADFTCAPCLQRTCNYKGSSEVKPACYTQLSPSAVFAALEPFLSNSPVPHILTHC